MIACFIRRLLSEHKRLILYPRYAQGEFRFYICKLPFGVGFPYILKNEEVEREFALCQL